MASFRDYLIEIHAKQYTGLDDDMPDEYVDWEERLDVEDVISYADGYAAQLAEKSYMAGKLDAWRQAIESIKNLFKEGN